MATVSDISHIIKDCVADVYIFYLANFENDVLQFEIMKNSSNMYVFPIKSDKHGDGPTSNALISMLKILDSDELCKLAKCNRNKI